MKTRIRTVLRLSALSGVALALAENSADANLLLKLDKLENEKVAQVEGGTKSLPPSKPSDAAVTAAPPAAKTPKLPDWTVQLRGTLGKTRIAGESRFQSDRLGAGLFAGKRLSDLELSLPFLETDGVIAGVAYQTATGVDPYSDRSWSVQTIGAQARVNFSPMPDSYFDVALQAGLGIQRLVSEEPLRRSQKALHSAGLTFGSYARTLLIDGIHGLAGADLTVGRGSSLSLSLGIESNL
ncbi:MAG: hypothetical protein EBR09_14050 [Proteobacteria bacterium]|nr:hypothetical protein [Pseudomonadota bacterium]